MESRLGKGRAADGKGDLLRGAMLSSHSSRPMKSRSVRQISLAGLSLFLLYVFLFSTSANAPSPFSRELVGFGRVVDLISLEERPPR